MQRESWANADMIFLSANNPLAILQGISRAPANNIDKATVSLGTPRTQV